MGSLCRARPLTAAWPVPSRPLLWMPGLVCWPGAGAGTFVTVVVRVRLGWKARQHGDPNASGGRDSCVPKARAQAHPSGGCSRGAQNSGSQTLHRDLPGPPYIPPLPGPCTGLERPRAGQMEGAWSLCHCVEGTGKESGQTGAHIRLLSDKTTAFIVLRY